MSKLNIPIRLVKKYIKQLHRLIKRARLARECAKLDPAFEKAMADEGLTGDLTEGR
jgi:hypothetical protein